MRKIILIALLLVLFSALFPTANALNLDVNLITDSRGRSYTGQCLTECYIVFNLTSDLTTVLVNSGTFANRITNSVGGISGLSSIYIEYFDISWLPMTFPFTITRNVTYTFSIKATRPAIEGVKSTP